MTNFQISLQCFHPYLLAVYQLCCVIVEGVCTVSVIVTIAGETFNCWNQEHWSNKFHSIYSKRYYLCDKFKTNHQRILVGKGENGINFKPFELSNVWKWMGLSFGFGLMDSVHLFPTLLAKVCNGCKSRESCFKMECIAPHCNVNSLGQGDIRSNRYLHYQHWGGWHWPAVEDMSVVTSMEVRAAEDVRLMMMLSADCHGV